MQVVPCEALWPGDGANEGLLHWGYIAGKLGAKPRLERPFLIGIRGAAPLARVTHQAVHRPVYDDSFVLLCEGDQPVLFEGATHAYQVESALSPDANLDGKKDVGSIRPGRYLLTDKGIKPHPIFVLTLLDGSGKIPAFRDTDHDGVLSEREERESMVARTGEQVGSDGCYATAVLLHTGFDAPPNAVHRSSIACQTCSLKWLELLRTRAARSGGVIDYVLANASELVPYGEERKKALETPPVGPGNVV